jgi:CheY-like chemotaxis protein
LKVQVDDLGLEITISDNGIGMSPNQIEGVFELFSQIPSAVEKSQGGLGIGLALARGLVELHGGTIAAASAGPGLGSTFTVRLPATCLSPLTIVADESGLPPKPDDSGSVFRRILIADDNVDAADSLAALLRLDGHEVHVAYDGDQALDLFAQVDPDAVLLDVAMPRVSGLQVAQSIRADSTGRRATLIAVTGFGQERDRRVAFESGFDHHLIKPVLPEDIEALLHQI